MGGSRQLHVVLASYRDRRGGLRRLTVPIYGCVSFQEVRAQYALWYGQTLPARLKIYRAWEPGHESVVEPGEFPSMAEVTHPEKRAANLKP